MLSWFVNLDIPFFVGSQYGPSGSIQGSQKSDSGCMSHNAILHENARLGAKIKV